MIASAARSRRPRTDPLRVMVVDDSTVVRGFLAQWVEAEPGFVVVGAASDGQQALDLLDVLRPDIVLLDLDMPVLDGLATLPGLLARRPDLSVVVVSTLTVQNAEISLECLARGAVDYLEKPGFKRDLSGTTAFRQELTRKLKGLAPRHRSAGVPQLPAQPGTLPLAKPAGASAKPRIVGIGASTGGPNALAEMLSGMAAVSARVPILVVQHMPELFTAAFAEQLRTKTGLPVEEAQDGEPIRAGRIYLARGGRHMRLAAVPDGPAAIRLDDGPAVHHCRPAVDLLFADLAQVFGASTLGLVLTGMGRDGTDGARAIVEAGGTVFAQDEATSTIWGMPGSVAKAGLARRVLPLGEIAPAVRQAVGVA